MIRPGWGWRYDHRPGQYVGIGVQVDGKFQWRSYSVSSPPQRSGRTISITVRAMPEGLLSAHLVNGLAPGTIVRLALPEGDFVLPDPPPARMLFLVGGSGITPVMAMLRTLDRARHHAGRRHALLLADRGADDLPRRARRRSRSGTTALTLHRLHTDIDGMLDLADLDEICPDWRERETWACGPGPMLDAISEHFEEAGLEDQLHLERFSLELGGDGGEGGTITFRNSSKTVEVDGATTVLEAGEEAGVGHALRLPDGHLPHLHAHARLRHDPRPAQRRRVRPAQRAGADLRHRRRRRLHARHLTHRERRRPMAISDVKEYTHLSEEEVEQLGRELDAIRAEIEESRGDADAAYINRMIKVQRGLAAAGRAPCCCASTHSKRAGKPALAAGAALLGLAKILENMEIGHNVMHGQWDWMNDPEIHSSNWEWDTAQPAEQWKHSHNYIHHQFTNVLGHDNDIGYGILRMAREQKWHPHNLGQPVYNALLASLFQWGVALHDLDLERIRKGEKDPKEMKRQLRQIARKGRNQILKDYVVYPALSRARTGRPRSRPTRRPTWRATCGPT